MNKVTVRPAELGLGVILFLIFLVLKLTENIDWSWLYVTMPLWIVPAVLLSLLIVMGAVYLPFWLVRHSRRINIDRIR